MVLEVIFSGFGGQGVLLAGELLAESAMQDNLHVTWVPSYGPEMRGGAANCAVVVSDSDIGSPVVAHPDALVVFNKPSLDKFADDVKPGGIIIINSSMMKNTVKRTDVHVYEVPCSDIAQELGNIRVQNMVALGALLALTKITAFENVIQALKVLLPARRHDLIPINKKALEKGGEAVNSATDLQIIA